MRRRAALAALATIALAGPAAAQEVWGGVSAHAVDTPFSVPIGEDGVDLQAGYRFAAIDALGGAEPYVLGVVNTRGDTSLAAAGLGWRFGERVYVRPALGIAIHDGPRRRIDAAGFRTDLGSRVLFEPELSLGWQATPRLGIEASWIHVSHAQLFGRQNPGLDIIGARLVLRLR